MLCPGANLWAIKSLHFPLSAEDGPAAGTRAALGVMVYYTQRGGPAITQACLWIGEKINYKPLYISLEPVSQKKKKNGSRRPQQRVTLFFPSPPLHEPSPFLASWGESFVFMDLLFVTSAVQSDNHTAGNYPL